MKCRECHRHFRSRAAYDLYLRRKAVEESLRDNKPCAHLADIELDKQARHRKAHHHFRQHGEKVAA